MAASKTHATYKWYWGQRMGSTRCGQCHCARHQPLCLRSSGIAKGIACPWVTAGSLATCTATRSLLDTVVALQRKVVWELQQKQVEEALYLHFAFKHNTSGLLACSQLSQQASHSYTGPAKAWDWPILAQRQKTVSCKFASCTVSPLWEPVLGCRTVHTCCGWDEMRVLRALTDASSTTEAFKAPQPHNFSGFDIKAWELAYISPILARAWYKS